MDFKKLHERYKDDASPSVELQIRWLQRIGFQPHQIDQAMITVYTEIEQDKKTFKDGSELNLYLKDVAVKVRSEELNVYITNLEKFEAKMRAKWEADQKKAKPWYRRIFG
jgi:hypothetical protein